MNLFRFFCWSTVRPFHPQFQTSQLLVCCTSTGIDTSAFPAIAWASNLCFKCPSWHPSKIVCLNFKAGFEFELKLGPWLVLNKEMKVGSMSITTLSSTVSLYPVLWTDLSHFHSPMQALLPSSSICAASRRVSSGWWWKFFGRSFYQGVVIHGLFHNLCKAFDCLEISLISCHPKSHQSLNWRRWERNHFGGNCRFWGWWNIYMKVGAGSHVIRLMLLIPYVLDICHRSLFILVFISWNQLIISLIFRTPKINLSDSSLYPASSTWLPVCNLQKTRLQSPGLIHIGVPHAGIFSHRQFQMTAKPWQHFSHQQNKMNNSDNSIKISNFKQNF